MTLRLAVILVSAGCAVLGLAACRKSEVRVYTVVKELPVDSGRDAGSPPATPAPRARPQLSYSLPEGWQEGGANSMSLASFSIKTDLGEATVNITPLGSMAGQEGAIVNLWREQVGQAPLADAEVSSALTPVEVAGEKGRLFEITGDRGGQTTRIVTAFVHREDGSWFYKLQGPEALVTAQKPAFVAFLKSVRIKDSPPAEVAADAGPEPKFKWSVPPSWQALPAGQMQVAKFSVSDANGAKAEVSVSIFPNDTGGLLANVNRWRKQLGLGDVDEAGLKSCVSALESPAGAMLADLANGERRLVGAIVPRDGRFWFYKMLGNAPAVNAEREAFIGFVQSQP